MGNLTPMSGLGLFALLTLVELRSGLSALPSLMIRAANVWSEPILLKNNVLQVQKVLAE